MSGGPELSFREVTKENLTEILNLNVADSQMGLVGSNAKSIAQAHFCETAWFRAVYAGDTPVGFVMLDIDPPKNQYYLWRIMIDGRYQGRSYGRRALQLVVDHVRTNFPEAKELTLSHVQKNGHAGPLYEKFGFVYAGEEDHGELVMKLVL